MTALTFNDALTKYRSDQARDSKGRFADEGGGRGRGSARDPRLGLARSLGAEDLYRAVLSAKGGTAKENARIKLDRELARRVAALSPAERASLSARDKRTVTDKITPYMTARQRRTWEANAQSLTSRAEELWGARGSTPEQLSALLNDIRATRMPKAEAHALARAVGVEFAPSATGAWAKHMAETMIFDMIKFKRHLRAKAAAP